MARSSWAMHAANRYRTVPESKVIDFLVLAGWAHAGANEDVSKHAGNALQRSVELGVKYQLSKAGDRLFDPVEVINQLKWSGRNGFDRFALASSPVKMRGCSGRMPCVSCALRSA